MPVNPAEMTEGRCRMATLLHLDSSPREGSVSRRVSQEFADAWRAANPAGRYLRRDLAAAPVPHIDQEQVQIMNRLEAAGVRDLDVARDAPLTPQEKASWEITWPLVEEVIAADTIVVGLPMHNFSVPSVFKAWFDRLIIPPLVIDPQTGLGPLAGRKVVVVTARGGAYGPGTPRAASDYQEPYLRAALAMIALDGDLTFLHAELTKSEHVPRLAQFRGLAEESLTKALDGARSAAGAG
jgi:FMN-dependent NADH-azoreductase